MNKKHRIVYRMDYALILQEKGHKVAGVMPNIIHGFLNVMIL
jgi:hypothetical protein